MALFGNLFKKKECAICGGEIGLLGNRKLEDGNMCKNCAAKLSPWFDDRRHSTVEQIKAQLEYRAKNEEELKSFNPTRNYGNQDKILIEDRNGVPYRFVVSTEKNWRAANPDIVLFKDVTACNFDVQRFENELTYEDADGEEHSYFPQRYEYKYNFFVELIIANNPYFEHINFKLNPGTLEIVSERTGNNLLIHKDPDHVYHPQYQIYKKMYDDIKLAVDTAKNPTVPGAGSDLSDLIMVLIEVIRTAPDFETIIETNKTVTALVSDLPNRDAYYALQTQAMKEANERVTAQMTAAAVASAPAPQAAPAADPKFCPSCGAPASGKFCENCGTKLF